MLRIKQRAAAVHGKLQVAVPITTELLKSAAADKHSFSSFADSRSVLCRQVQEEEQIECGPEFSVDG